MKFVFLDIDGVVNNGLDRFNYPFFEEEKMRLLAALVKKANANIILISSWKELWNEDVDMTKYINSQFAKYDLKIMDKTPDCIRKRGDAVVTFLEAHNETKSPYVILDDCDQPDYHMYGNHEHMVLVKRGLSQENVNKAFSILQIEDEKKDTA